VLYSYASLDIITVFFLTISVEVCCLVTLELKSPAMRIVYTLMFAAIGERPELQGWALKAPSSRGACQLMVNHLYFICKLTLRWADSKSSGLWGNTSQHHLASLTAAVVPN